MKKRVLHIITNLTIGGAQDNTLLTVERLDREKYNVDLMVSDDGEWVERSTKISNLTLIFINEIIRPVHIIKDFIAFYKMYKVIKKNKYDIVHTHSSKPGFLGRIAASLAGVKIIIHTIHGFPFNYFMPSFVRWFFINIERFLSLFTHKLITVSNLNLQKAIDLKIASPKKLINIYSGIDFQKFNKNIDISEKKAKLNIPPQTKVTGFVGRLSKQKAPEYFIEAAHLISQKKDDVIFLLIGDGNLRSKCEKLTKKLNLDSKVTFLGSRDDVPELLQILDVYVLSSLWEGLGRSLTEALYLSIPTVATNVEGVPELIKNNETGILVPPANSQAIADGVLTILNNYERGIEMAHNASKFVKENFSAEKMVSDIDELYQKLL